MSEKLKIVYRPLQKLSPYAHNARTHSPEQVAQLVESIKQFGWTNPVLIDEKGEIIAGHGRVMAAEVLKMDSVPVIVLSCLKEDQKKAYRLADNRLPLNAGWDEDLLQELEIERRRMENQKLRKEIETVEGNEHPLPVAININVVDARVRSDEDDLSDA